MEPTSPTHDEAALLEVIRLGGWHLALWSDIAEALDWTPARVKRTAAGLSADGLLTIEAYSGGTDWYLCFSVRVPA